MKFPNMFDLSKRVALITGGAQGLGENMAIGFAEAGAKVAIVDMKPAIKVVKKIKELGQEAISIEADATSQADVIKSVKEITNYYGSLDILVNNVGGGPITTLILK